jgi:DNA-binding NarL/FixJ family response regulator
MKNESIKLYDQTEKSIELINKYGNKSKAIRELSKEGKTNSEIAKLLNIRYQHVRNVLNTIVKKVS